LLVDSLQGDYTKSWMTGFALAFDSFRENLAKGSKTKYDQQPDEFWSRYGLLTRSATDRPDTIERRHQFFLEKMYAMIDPKLKDVTRTFGEVEKELIYYRDKKKCQLPTCGADVVWADAEYHHVLMHSKGGLSTLENGALFHKDCHPKSEKAVKEFADFWKVKLEKQAAESATSAVASTTALLTVKRGKRGRPKMTPEETLVKMYMKVGGMPHDEALKAVQGVIEAAKDL
jgi:hypothetical protein